MVAIRQRKHQGVGQLQAHLPVAKGCADKPVKRWLLNDMNLRRDIKDYLYGLRLLKAAASMQASRSMNEPCASLSADWTNQLKHGS